MLQLPCIAPLAFVLVGIGLPGPSSMQFGEGCRPSWLPAFGGEPGMGGPVSALVAYDDGTGGGPAPYAGGSFTTAGGIPANRIARWDGTSWSSLGGGLNSHVKALTVYDDGGGGGPALYAGGSFTTAGGVAANYVARWDGTSWSGLGTGLNLSVQALAVYDDGGGPALFAGGHLTSAGGVPANHVARWDGVQWSSPGSGVGGGPGISQVHALAVYDDGSGSALHVAGEFTVAGGVAAKRIAKWNGTSWSALGKGTNDAVRALTILDDGSGGGPALFAGGSFTVAGGNPAQRIAKWNGTAWSSLASGLDDVVLALEIHDDGGGGGPALYVGGNFKVAGGVAAKRIARWDGTSWSPLAGGIGNTVQALLAFDDGAGGGQELYAGGDVKILKWDGASWASLGVGLNDDVRALAVYDDGGGSALYVGGKLTTAGGVAVNRIAKWDGTGWSALASGTNGIVQALGVHEDGGGRALFVGGRFTKAGGTPADHIAKWNGASWSPLGSGLNDDVNSLAVYDDGRGTGAALYAGGAFTAAGGVPLGYIAKWDGTAWTPLGAGMRFDVHALCVFDEGSGGGSALFAGGSFQSAGGEPASFIAKWDGTSWSPLESGTNSTVQALTVYRGGPDGGRALHAAGWFTIAGGTPASRIARWNGAEWSPLGSGVSSSVRALVAFDDGTGGGPALYAGGSFPKAGSQAMNYIARWNGRRWSPLGSGVTSFVNALTVYDDGGGPALYAGGVFASAPDSGDSYLAKWGCLITSSGTVYCTAGVAASGCQAQISATGAPSATAATGFTLQVANAEGAKAGIFLLGTNGRQANPWGSSTSYQCVVPPVKRGGLLGSVGAAGLCDGAFSQDLNALWCPSCPKPLKNPGAGAVVQAQLWYRDPFNTSNQTTSLSDAIEFCVGP
jgi:hypothetical protein